MIERKNLCITFLDQKETHFVGIGIATYDEPIDCYEMATHLSSSEYQVFSHLKFEKKRENFLLGRLAAKEALLALLGPLPYNQISIESGIFSFPIIRSDLIQNKNVSIAHTGKVAIAIAFDCAFPCGIDIEKIIEQPFPGEKDFLTEIEQKLSAKLQLTNSEKMTLFWTAKESLSKTLKTGLTTPLRLFEISSTYKIPNGFNSQFKNFLQYQSLSFISTKRALSITLPKQAKCCQDISDYLTLALH